MGAIEVYFFTNILIYFCFVLLQQDQLFAFLLINSVSLFYSFIGILTMCLGVGMDSGSSIMGMLFHWIGTRMTLLVYAVLTGFVLIVFLTYIKISTRPSEYEKLHQDDYGDDCENDENFN